MNKSVVITNEQLHRFKGRMLKETFVVNTTIVNDMKSFLDKKFRPITYDDIDTEGENKGFVVQKIAIDMLDSNGEPVQRISNEKLLDKLDAMYKNNIKDDKERRDFIKQVIKDWANGDISKEGLLTVNSTGC